MEETRLRAHSALLHTLYTHTHARRNLSEHKVILLEVV